jgi:VIT1/CCC1 family predicted Fe2+/Mn2+ transporter
VGASKTIVTGRSWLKSGMEMTVVGVGEALVTYGIGLLIAPVLR